MEAAQVADQIWKPAPLYWMNVKADLVGIYSMTIDINH
jgi:hypothetical protein